MPIVFYEAKGSSLKDEKYLKELFNGETSDINIKNKIREEQIKMKKKFTIIIDNVEDIMNEKKE